MILNQNLEVYSRNQEHIKIIAYVREVIGSIEAKDITLLILGLVLGKLI